ncbi:MAG: peptidylprolyl isomerase [Xanthomonadales bacterium]|nr:peptidylprolyl isomerase [Xanthomonadales bacterium]
MNKLVLMTLLSVFMFVLTTHAGAGSGDPIITQGDSIITQEEFDARLSKIKQSQQLPFLTDGGRVEKVLRQLMMDKRLADVARAAGFDDDPLVQGRLNLAIDQELAIAWLDSIEAKNLESANFELMAKEYYLTHKTEFQIPASVDVAHILIANEVRTDIEALELANQLYSRLRSKPELWDELVQEYSDDPGSKANHGKYLAVVPGKMVKPFEDTAFGIQTLGEIAAPTKTQFGYHLIRLDGKSQPKIQGFEQVKTQLIAHQRNIYTKAARTDYISTINTEGPLVIPPCAIEEMLARHFNNKETNNKFAECQKNPVK